MTLLSGRVDETGDMTGEDFAFIYPDLHSALVGTFKAGIQAVSKYFICSYKVTTLPNLVLMLIV